MYKLTVIMPCYNVEKYIEKAFESVIKSSVFEQTEIIAVDDCSTDSTKEIIKDYAKKYKNIKGFYNNKPSGGPGNPRNVALNNATGEYIVLLDPDDMVINDGHKVLLNAIENYGSDLVIACRIRAYENDIDNKKAIYDWKGTKCYNSEDTYAKINIIYRAPYYLEAIMRRDIIEKNKLRFREDLSMSEDEIFCNQYLNCCKTITKIDDVVYRYTMFREGSITTNINFNEFEKYEKSWFGIAETLKDYPHIVLVQRMIDITNYYVSQLFRLESIDEQVAAFEVLSNFVNSFFKQRLDEKKLSYKYMKDVTTFINKFSNGYEYFLREFSFYFVKSNIEKEKCKVNDSHYALKRSKVFLSFVWQSTKQRNLSALKKLLVKVIKKIGPLYSFLKKLRDLKYYRKNLVANKAIKKSVKNVKNKISIEKNYFSIISCVYNEEKNIVKMLKSLKAQSVKYDGYEIIIVNDASTDKTDSIVKKYMKNNSGLNIKYHCSEKNLGPGASRNIGISMATGKILGFLDSDDMYSNNTLKEVYNFFSKNIKEVDIVAMPVMIFGSVNAEHGFNNKFSLGTRVINLKEDFDVKQFSASSCFVKADVFRDYNFSEKLFIAEDLLLLTQILNKNLKLGVIDNVKYWYRQHKASTSVNSSISNVPLQFLRVNKVLLYLVENYNNKFTKSAVAQDIGWILSQKAYLHAMNSSEQELMLECIFKVASYLDLDSILDSTSMENNDKIMLLMENDENFLKDITYENNMFLYNEKNISSLFLDSFLNIDYCRIKNGVLTLNSHIKGSLNLITNKIVLKINDTFKEAKNIIENDDLKIISFNRTLCSTKFYVFEELIELNSKIEILIELNNNQLMTLDTVIPDANRSLYSDKECNFLYDNGNALLIQDSKMNYINDNEIIKEILLEWQNEFSQDSNMQLEAVNNLVSQNKKSDKYTIVISDRPNKAGDNGEAFFTYLQSKKNKDIGVYFLIEKYSNDVVRLKKLGKVVYYNTTEYFELMIRADIVLSSHTNEFREYFNDFLNPLRPFCNYKRVFLQHGIFGNNIKSYTNIFNLFLDGYVVSSHIEVNGIKKYNMGYDNCLLETCLPRYDLIRDNISKEKMIVIMPTWRMQLLDFKAKRKNGALPPNYSNIYHSEFFKQYYHLLSSGKIVDLAEKYNYKIVFAPHFDLKNIVNLFNIDKRIEIDMHVNYSEVIKKADILITDISSVAFDFAYVNTPIIYFQPDYEQLFYSGSAHKEGLFSYELDGFGDVVYTDYKLYSTLEEMLKKKIEIDNSDFYLHSDKNNSERLYELIIKK